MRNLFSLRGAQIKSHGRPGFDAKAVLSSIILVIGNGVPWCDAPSGHGPCKTPDNPFTRWSQTGYVQKICAGLARSLIVGVLLAFTAASPAHDATATTTESQLLPEKIDGLDDSKESEARGVSADGNVFVGQSEHAFRWTKGVMTDLLTLCTDDAACSSIAYDVSADGSVVVGRADYDPDKKDNYHAVLWSKDVMTDLGILLTESNSEARGVNHDGSVVVGWSKYKNNYHAFRWTKGVMTDLGTLKKGSHSQAFDVSADGSVVVGMSNTSNHLQDHAVLWTRDTITDLGTLRKDNSGDSRAYGVSADGKFVVGWARIKAPPAYSNRAFLWTEKGGMVNLGTLGGDSCAHDVSAHGKFVVGSSYYKNNKNIHAFLWTEKGGMVELGTLDGDQSEAYGISEKGTVVVGEAQNSQNQWRAFIWKKKEDESAATEAFEETIIEKPEASEETIIEKPEPSTAKTTAKSTEKATGVMQDFENLVFSVGRLAANRGRILGQALDSAADVAAPRCDRFAANRRFCIETSLGGGRRGFSGNGRNGSAELSLGMAVTDRIAAGINYAVSRLDTGLDGLNSVKADSASDLSLWAGWKQDPWSGTGLSGVLAVGGGWRSDTYFRGWDLDHVERARAKAGLRRDFARVSLGYGLARGNWLLTSGLSLSHKRAIQGAMEESGVVFPVAVDKARAAATIAGLALAADISVGERGTVLVSEGIEATLNASDIAVAGRSEIPGLKRFSLGGPERHRVRARAGVGYRYRLSEGSSVRMGLNAATAAYRGGHPDFGMAIGYALSF